MPKIRCLVSLNRDTDAVLTGVRISPEDSLPVRIQLDAESAERYGDSILETLHAPETVENAEKISVFNARQVAQAQAPTPTPKPNWKPVSRVQRDPNQLTLWDFHEFLSCDTEAECGLYPKTRLVSKFRSESEEPARLASYEIQTRMGNAARYEKA